MEPYPHRYAASAHGALRGPVSVSSAGLPALTTAPAPQFGGPGGVWSPETLLIASIADCYVLTFRAVSGAALFGWIELECRVEGILGRLGRQVRFTDFALVAILTVAPGADRSKAKRLLTRSERACLLINSLQGRHTLDARVLEAGGEGRLARAVGPVAP